MAWSIAEVARMSGVTARTLRHYDRIGLLPPAFIGTNGHRHYREDDLLRLQQILLMRELGLGLAEIAAVLDRQLDRTAALREHLRRLRAERSRLDALVRTVERTLAALDAAPAADRDGKDTEPTMATINRPENLFEGFDHSRYADEARERWPEQYAQSQAYAATLTAEDEKRMQRELTEQLVRMAEHMTAGTPVTDDAVQAEVHLQYERLCRFWTPDATAFTCLGRMYVDDPRFRATYDQVADGLAAYVSAAMSRYASTRLDHD